MTPKLFTFPSRIGTDSIKWRAYPQGVLPLWVADMDFTSPPEVIAALQQRMAHGIFGYADETEQLTALVVERMQHLYGWEIEPDDVLLVPGVIAGFNLTCQAVTTVGLAMTIQPPIYPPFFGVAANAGITEIQSPLENDGSGNYQVNFASLEKALRKSKFFLFCNPHNPVGKVYTLDELQRIADLCVQNDVILCSDEIHSDLVFSGSHHIPIASLNSEIAQRAVTLIAPSKTYNVAGLDCAVLICQNKALMKTIKKQRRGIMGGVNLLGAGAAIAAYQHGQVWLAEVLEYLQSNRDFLVEYIRTNLPAIKIHTPQATYLAWLDCRALGLETDPYTFFLEKAKVALNKGADFGGDGESFVRLNFACERATLVEALERMRKAL